jgi:uncharacterized Zn-binding protein involved in type VI secretion
MKPAREFLAAGSLRLVGLREPEGMGSIERQRQMAVGPAGTVNTNVPPQNYGGVSTEQVEKFEEAVNHSTTSSNASGMQSSKGEHTSEHSQDASKSLPFVLATRPPINLGNPIGKQGAPSQAGAAPAAQGAQIKERRLEGKISDDPKKAQDGKNAGKPPDTTLQTVLTNSGMKNVGNPPSEADLKTYHSKNGPAHQLITKGSYQEAATEYRKLADKATDPAEQKRLTMVADQLEVAQKMKTAKVGSLQFPPTETNVTDYFKTMKGKPISEIKDAFQNYANAFYVHSEKKGVDRGDVVYSEHKYKEGKTVYNSHAPVSWKEVTDNREVHSDGRRIIDCEGYAYMGQQIFQAAGFQNVNFGVVARKDDPNTPQNESLTDQHIMVSGSRTIMVDGKPKTEMAVISNNRIDSTIADDNLKLADLKTFQTGLFAYAFQQTYGDKVPGGLIRVGPEAWREEFKLEDDIKAWQKK